MLELEKFACAELGNAPPNICDYRVTSPTNGVAPNETATTPLASPECTLTSPTPDDLTATEIAARMRKWILTVSPTILE
ncbi:MAG: hypothetical protein O7B81_06060 [Gammaproteobacteria bacterium]|nr:hypothetical protein [Gammaproteobacteria bacterium]